MKKRYMLLSQVVLLSIVLFTGCQKEEQKITPTTKAISHSNTGARLAAPSNYVGIDFASNTGSFHYFTKDSITAPGTFNDTDYDPYANRAPYFYSPAPNQPCYRIAGIAIYGSGGNQEVFTYYLDGTMSKGVTNDLDYYVAPVPYTTATGKNPSNIVGISIASTGRVYTWYNDGKVSSGSTTNLASVNTYSYTPATGKAYSSIVEMAIDRNHSDRIYTYYSDSTVSIGISNDLDYYSPPVPFD